MTTRTLDPETPRPALDAAESAPVMIWLTDPAGACVYLNRRWYEFTGTGPAENLGHGWLDRLHPDDRPAAAAAWAHQHDAHAPLALEYRLRRNDGVYRHVTDAAEPRFGPAGEFLGYAGAVTDVTDRRAAGEALRDREARLRLLIDRMPLACMTTDADFRVASWNPAAERMFGFTAADVVGRSPFETIIPPEAAPYVEGIRRRLAAGDFDATGYNENATKDGRRIWCEWSNTPLVGPDGRVTGFLSMAQDVTARVEAERKLAASEERLRSALSAAQIGSWDWNVLTGEIVWSEWHERLFGFAPGGFRGTYAEFRGRVHPDDLGELERAVAAARDGRTPYRHKYRVVWPDGTVRWVRGQGGFHHDAAGRPVRMTGLLTDVTERKQTEAEKARLEQRVLQSQKLESLGVLAGGIAHDFNNLLAGVLGYAGLALAELPADAPAAGMIREVEAAGRRAADLVQQMLAYAGRAAVKVEPLDLSLLVRETHRLLRAAVSKTAELELHLPDGLPAVEGDGTQLRQVVMNLITNASDALGGRGGRVSIRTGRRNLDRPAVYSPYADAGLPPGRYVYVEVADTGCGMTPDVQARIFDPFFTTKFTGRGLGLAATLGIVRAHRGLVRVDSRPGAGTTFEVLFPAGATRPDAPAASGPTAAAAGRGTVLVVEDEEGVRTLARLVLERAGYAVLTAADGREGVDLFHAEADRLAAVLLDLTMPRLSGREVLAEIRGRRPDLPVVVMSGYGEQELAGTPEGAAATAFVRKPFSPGQLVGAVAEAVGGAG